MATLAAEGIDALLAKDGPHLVGQEAVTLSTTPAMLSGRLQPRPMILRVFAARTARGWSIMPGGYARIGRSEDATAIAMQAGGSVADVWVLGDTPVRTDTLTPRGQAVYLRRSQPALPARAADNLYWLGRYIERAEGRLRLLRAYHLRRSEADGEDWPLLAHIETVLKRYDIAPDRAAARCDPVALLPSRAAARARCATGFPPMAGGRCPICAESGARSCCTATRAGDEAVQALGLLMRKLAGFSGLVHENMFQDAGWRFLSFGRALERAENMTATLIDFADPDTPPGAFDLAVEFGDSQISHRRRYAVETNRATVVDLLALDPQNPRGLAYQTELMRDHEAALPRARQGTRLSLPGQKLLTLSTDLAVATPGTLDTPRLKALQQDIYGVSNALSLLYFG